MSDCQQRRGKIFSFSKSSDATRAKYIYNEAFKWNVSYGLENLPLVTKALVIK